MIFRHTNELRNFALTHNNESSLFAALNMVCSWCCKTHGVRLVSFGDAIA